MRTPDQLVLDRTTGLAAFHQSRSEPIEVGPGHGAARETRHEHERREAVRLREQEALREREAATAASSGDRLRAVVLHRAPWTREALRKGLEAAGVDVVALHEDGAAGLGCVVAEQPDLVLVQQQLPWRHGLEVVADVRRFAPSTLIGVHLDQPGSEGLALAAGAHRTWPRATRPTDLVQGLLALQLARG